MPKVTFAPDIETVSGKLCKDNGVVYCVNHKTGQTYRQHRHKAIQPNSEKQQAVKAEFKTKSQFASQWWNTNKPAPVTGDSSSVSKGTDAYQAVMKAYKAQSKIGNPYSFLRSLVTDDLKVILKGQDLTGGVVAPDANGSGTSTDQGGNRVLE